jgi:uncharacterized membrane protein
MRVAALLFAISAALSWSVGGILLKKGLGNVSPTTILVFQYVVGALLIGGWLVATGGAGQAVDAAERRWLPLLGIALLQIVGYVCFVVAVKHAGAGSMPTAAVLAVAASYPAIVAVLSGPFLGERLGWNHALGIALVFSGVVVTQIR